MLNFLGQPPLNMKTLNSQGHSTIEVTIVNM